MTDPNVEFVRKVMEQYDREQELAKQRMRKFTSQANEELDQLTPTRRTNAINTA